MDKLIDGISNLITQRKAYDIAQELPIKSEKYHQDLLNFIVGINSIASEKLEQNFIFKKACYFITELPANNRINQSHKIRVQQEILDCLYNSYDKQLDANPDDWLSVEKNDNKCESVPLQDSDTAVMVLTEAFQQWEASCIATLTSYDPQLKNQLTRHCQNKEGSWIDLCFLCNPSYQEPHRRALINTLLRRDKTTPETPSKHRLPFIKPPVVISQKPSSQKRKQPSVLLSSGIVDDRSDDEGDLTFTSLVNNAAKSFSELFFFQKGASPSDDDEEACHRADEQSRPHHI